MGIWTVYCDRDAWLAGTAERAYVKYLDGGCSSPVAAFAEVDGNEIFIRGLYYSEATGKWLTGQIRGAAEDGEKLGIALAKQLYPDEGKDKKIYKKKILVMQKKEKKHDSWARFGWLVPEPVISGFLH